MQSNFHFEKIILASVWRWTGKGAGRTLGDQLGVYNVSLADSSSFNKGAGCGDREKETDLGGI